MRGRKPKAMLILGEKTKNLIAEIATTLSDRGIKDFGGGELIEFLVENVSKPQLNSFVSEMTPLEYKLKVLLQNESAKKDFDKLAKKHDFGLSSENLGK